MSISEVNVEEKENEVDSVVSKKSGSNSKLATRDDVVNKTLLRSIKRFYLNKFKAENKKLVRDRFKNTKVEAFLEVLEEMCVKEFPNHKNPNLLAQYMMIFLGLKPGNRFQYNQNIASKACQAVN